MAPMRENQHGEGISTPETVRFAIARPPFFEGPLRMVATAFAALLVVLSLDARGFEALLAPGEGRYVVFGGIALVVLLAVLRLVTRPRGDLAVELGPAALVLPRTVSSRRTVTVPYAEIRDLEVRGGPQGGLLLLDTLRGLRVLPLGRFRDVTAAIALPRALRDRLLAQPGGRAQLVEIVVRREHAEALAERRARVTIAVLAVIALAFALELRTGALEDAAALGLLQLGASAPALVREGAVWRLFTANLLHGGFLHAILNGFALLSLGGLLERWLGGARFTFVLLVSCLGGALASALSAQALFSVGVSTGLFGLLGALAFVHLRHRAVLPAGFRQSRTWWLVILGLNFSLPLIVPVIDGMGHAGGFVTGFAATALVDRGLRPDTRGSARLARLLALVSAGSFAVSVGVAIAHGTSAQANARDLVTIARALRTRPIESPADAEPLNVVAWTLAIGRDTPAAAWPLLREVADRAVEHAAPEVRSDYLDTRATVSYRLGRQRPAEYDEAVRIELQALAAAPGPGRIPPEWRARQQRAYATQLARFLDARHAVAGPIALAADPRRVTVRLAREGVSARHDGEGEVLVHAVVLAGGAIAGLVEACARPVAAATSDSAATEAVEPAFAPAGTGSLLQARVVVARVDGRPDASRVSRVLASPFVAADDDILTYP
jgi:membrane associated rhomboid family serine protease